MLPEVFPTHTNRPSEWERNKTFSYAKKPLLEIEIYANPSQTILNCDCSSTAATSEKCFGKELIEERIFVWKLKKGAPWGNFKA